MNRTHPPEPAGVPSRVDRRRERTRGRLLAAAGSLIGERGVGALRISDITERADVALGSFYNHFDSKEEITAEVASKAITTLAESVAGDGTSRTDRAVVVARAIRRFIAVAYEDESLARLIVNLENADALFASAVQPFAQRTIVEGVAAERFSPVSVETAVVVITGACFALIRQINAGALGPGAEEAMAVYALLLLGVPEDEATAIAAAAGD